MDRRDRKTTLSSDSSEAALNRSGTEVHGDSCRCEEVSKMNPRQLLGLMLSDLAFWKKPELNKKRES